MRFLPLAQFIRDADKVLVIKGEVNGLTHARIHLSRVSQVLLLLNQFVEELAFALEQDSADARDQICQLIYMRFELLVLGF